MDNIIEETKELSAPLVKLIDVIAVGCGKVYEPTHIKRMAKARANEINIIGNEMNKKQYLPMQYKSEQLTIDTTQQNELLQRAQQRFWFQEIEKQKNIDAVIMNAYEEIENIGVINDEHIDKDWTIRFFNLVEDISNEDLQRVWAKILVGEIKQPGSYSYRTMVALSMFTAQDIQLIEELFDFIINLQGENVLLSDKEVISKGCLSILKRVRLQNMGIISSEVLHQSFELKAKDIYAITYSKTLVCMSKRCSESNQVGVRFNTLTEIGNELYALSDYNSDNTIMKFAKSIKFKDGSCATTVHKINSINLDNINYDNKDLIGVSNIENK